MEKTRVLCRVVTSWVPATNTPLESVFFLCCLLNIVTEAQQLNLIAFILPSVFS